MLMEDNVSLTYAPYASLVLQKHLSKTSWNGFHLCHNMLDDLPFELLSHIVSYLPTAQSVHHLALSCRALNDVVQKEGWKVFARSRFPSVPVPGHWRDASHALTTLSRNWDRRALLPRYLNPSSSITILPGGERKPKWSRPIGQTMGYQPVIDSYEEWNGNTWSSRREVLAWSAGAEMILRTKQMGEGASELWEECSAEERDALFDHHRHKIDWYIYKPPGSVEGRDDITSINILRPSYNDRGAHERLILGTANGDLSLIEVPLTERDGVELRRTSFRTSGRPVRSAHVSPSSSHLAACLSDTRVALYSLDHAVRPDSDTDDAIPISEITVVPENRRGQRAWSTRFLSDSRVAVGLGPSTEPVHVYEVTPSELRTDAVRKFGLDGTLWACDDRVVMGGTHTNQSSVYPIIPIPASSQAGHAAGDVFLSGGYDGMIR